MELVYFLYGLSFVAIGVAVLAQPRHRSRFQLAKILWMFAGYALLHAAGDFIDAWIEVHGPHPDLALGGSALVFTAYLFLFEFGRRLWGLSRRTLPWWVLPLAAAASLGGSAFSANPLAVSNVLVGYLVRFPGGLLSAAGLLMYYRSQREALEPLGLRKYFVTGVLVLVAWSFFCGLVRARADLFPASVLNLESFRQFTGIPVQMFRAACGLVTAWAFGGMLQIFHWEVVARDNLDRAKDELLATVSHEMKTPLAAVSLSLSHIEAVMGAQLPGRAAELLGGARSNLRRLGRLITDVLDLESLRVGRVKLHLEPLGAADIVEASLGELREVATQHEVRLVAEIEAGEALAVTGDREFLGRVLANLVMNAIKFSPPGGQVRVAAAQHPNGLVRFTVTDCGPGIRPDQVPLLFNRFQTFEPADGRPRGGNGLGLAISRSLIEHLGGRIGLQSASPRGAVFYFELPSAQPAAKQAPCVPAVSAERVNAAGR